MLSTLPPKRPLGSNAASPVPVSSAEVQCAPPVAPSAPRRPSGDIIVCERRIAIDTAVVNWQDDPRFSAYRLCGYRGQHDAPPALYPFNPARGMDRRTMRYRPRKELLGRRTDLGVLKRVIRQAVLHHDGAQSSAECFHILHDERGLSAHFLIDNDGTIYQTLDLADVAFHAQTANSCSLGIELCNRGRVELAASEASRQGRDQQKIRVHGYEYNTWSFTTAQYQALAHLLSALFRLFPELARVYPSNGRPIYSALQAPETFSGVLGHYHLTTRKWDPGCLDFARLMKSVGGQPVWFATVAPEVAPGAAAAESARESLLAANEQRATGGFYPVGPCGDDLVWHGGIHLALAAGAPLSSSFPGQIVAARRRDAPTANGSADFVLVRYDRLVQGQRLDFYLLLYHLDFHAAAAAEPDWLRKLAPELLRTSSAQGVFFPGVEVMTGELLGYVGSAGPVGAVTPQVHVEVMAGEEVTARFGSGTFQPKDCASSGLVCLDPELHAALGGQSVLSFVRSTRSDPKAAVRLQQLRRLAVRAPSEWAVPGAADLTRLGRESREFRRLPPSQQGHIVGEQLAPHWWLTPEVAQRVGLPTDLLAWHYHPIEFLAWAGAIIGQREGQRERNASALERLLTPPLSGPAEDGAHDDEGYASEEDLGEWELGTEAELSLEEIAQGFPEHWLKGRR